MISAFKVKTTPSDTSKVKNMLSRPPPAAVTAPPSANARAEARATLIETSPAADGLTDTARSASPARVLCSQNVKPDAKYERTEERDDAVEAVAFAENEDRLRQIGVVQIFAAEHRQHDADADEAQAEGREDAVDLELALALGAPNQRQDQHPVDRPVQHESRGHDQDQRQSGLAFVPM